MQAKGNIKLKLIDEEPLKGFKGSKGLEEVPGILGILVTSLGLPKLDN